MGVFSRVRSRKNGAHVAESVEASEPRVQDTEGATSSPDTLSLEARDEKENLEHPDQVTQNADLGVRKAEAAALVWTKKSVWATYGWIWICYFMLALQEAIGNNIYYYAYASFSSAPQISTAGIVATIIGGVIKLPLAKILNLWGRAEGLIFSLVIYEVGMIIMASCNGPNSYAAGYTLYWIGYDTLYLMLEVFLADTAGLRNRAFAFGFATTPFICTAFTGSRAASAILNTTTWRWGYGIFIIVQPFVFLPLAAIFKFFQKRAEKQGLFTREKSGRTWIQSFIHYFHEFDIIGACLLMAAFILFLLPFSLEEYGMAEYGTAKFIAMVVIGVCLFPVFYIWEKYFTRVHFIRWELLKNRTILGAFILAAVLDFSFYCWDLYYYYFVEVVYNLSITNTGYMTEIYTVGSCFWSPIFGIWVRYTKEFKWTCLCFGLPLLFLGNGLMIHFRGEDGQIGYIIMCQIFIAFAGGTLVIGEEMAAMAASNRDGVPMLLSILGLASSVGSSIGYAVSAAIYANTFPSTLYNALPDYAKANYTEIYNGGSTVQMTYPMGSEVREAINYAWGYEQRCGAIAGTAILVIAIPAIAIWKNYRLDKPQNKGVVF